MIVDSYKDMESTVDVSDSTLSFVACIPICVATDSVSYVSGARKTAFGLPTACRQGAREAWAMVKTRYTKSNPNRMAEVGPVGPDGKEIPVSLVYGQVELAAKYSQQDCKLDNLLDGIEEEYTQSN